MYTIFKTYHSHSLFLGLVKQQILQILIFLLAINHSLLKLLTGFAIAAFIASKLTLANAVMTEAIPPAKNIHQLKWILNAKFCSHLFMKYQATGVEIKNAMVMSHTNSFENR